MFREMAFNAESGQALLNAEESRWQSVLQQCAEQLESSAALLLEGYVLGGHAPTAAPAGQLEPALDGLLQNIERVAGLCRLFDARRATVFCADLAALLTQLVGTPGPLAVDTLALASVSLLQVTRFLTSMRAPITDTHFDVETLNALRLAIGKRPLPPQSSGRTGVQDGVQDGPWNACDTTTVRVLLMRRIRGAQAMLGPPMVAKVEAEDPASALLRELAPELVRELHAISSVLQVLGPQRLGVTGLADNLDPESAAGFLLKLELQLSVETRALRRTSGSVCAGELAAVDCLLRDARRQWRATAYRRLHTMVTSLDHAPLDHAPLEPGALPERAGLELVALWDSLRLTDELHPGLVPHAEWSLLLAAGARLFRHLLCWQSVALGMDGSISPTLAMRGRQLVLRLQLNALDCLSVHAANAGDLPPLPGWRRQQIQILLRDCQHFERLQRTVWRRRLAVECTPDAALLCTFREELRETLVLLERGSGWPQSDAFCTVVARLSQNALVVGEVLLHEVLDALRQLFTALLERQESIGDEELVLLESVREHLQRRLHELPSPEDDALVTLQSCIGRRMARLHAPQADISDVFVEGGRAPQTRIAITQLPVYLAQNIRELLSAAERLEICLAAGVEGRAEFVALNRVLIVELRMLATGARALQVYRVARLSAVLAELHQALAVPATTTSSSSESCFEPDLLAQLVEAHCLLRRGLNQAAARREVDNPRDVIAGLYRRLDQLQASLVAPLTDRLTEWQPRHDPACYNEFRREAEALVHRMESDVDAMATGVGAAADVYRDMLHALHTLKGNARLFACESLASVCHRCESVLLGAKDAAFVQAGAVAERDVDYGGGLSRAGPLCPSGTFPQANFFLAPLVSELRAALDELPVAASVPLPPEHGIAIPAASLQRIAALAGSARTQVRAALDVLHSCRQESDAARLSLLADLLTEQERCVVQLDEEVAGSRLVSFSRVTPRLQRLVGQHSNQLDRQLRLRVRNDGLRVDRLLLERLVAPLEHLLRNAVDHGIEPVAVRRACGKADGGTVLLELQECDDQLVLELRDDGAGISNDALLTCAARLGMADSEEAPERRLQWVLRPGFTTRVQATQDSGHGIGLAMVNSVVTALGGRVEVESTPGIGSCFRLLLPRWDIASKPV